MLRLRWTYQSRGFSFAMGLSDTPVNRAAAAAKAAEIEKDLAFHEFDLSLEKYQPKPIPKSLKTSELFQQFIDYKIDCGDIAEQSAASVYTPLKNLIGKKNIRTKESAKNLIKILEKKRLPKSFNHGLMLYKAFGKWAVSNGYMGINPFAEIKLKRATKTPNKRIPFTLEEIKKILETFAENEKLNHYYDFVFLLFSLGLRPSEAIGLRWGAVDLDGQTVTISEALIRSPGQGRKRKGTKNAIIRELQLSASLTALLQRRRPQAPDPDQLIFTSKRGRPINDNIFRRNYWMLACKLAGVTYRPPYTARHTLISHGIESQGWSLPQAAQVAGDSVSTVVANYVHAIKPAPMPEW